MKWTPKDPTILHKWFAWYPIRTEEGHGIWLEYVYRALVDAGYDWAWVYYE